LKSTGKLDDFKKRNWTFSQHIKYENDKTSKWHELMNKKRELTEKGIAFNEEDFKLPNDEKEDLS
jgi:hypothetical protein